MSKPVILTGLRANNSLHLGNYLGGLLPIIELAKEKAGDYQINLFIPDLHSFTTPIDFAKLQSQVRQNLAVFAAAGLPLDHPDIHVYRQSYIPAHSELTIILNSFTGMGEMNRMTQYKDKSAKLHEDRISVGLFNYPVLMAADILLYQATYVPVGADQTQHLEFTRDIAERMNNQFGNLFTVPLPVKKQHEFFGNRDGLRIRDLSDPTKKMSKSDETGKGVIYLTDSVEDVKKKIIAAETDSVGVINYDYKTQPGISNLLDILELFGGNKNDFLGKGRYGDLKSTVAGVVCKFIASFHVQLENVDFDVIESKLVDSEEQMRFQANDTLMAVQKAVGLRS